nr:hypothetical protein [uncultured Actinoplanes sp.]
MTGSDRVRSVEPPARVRALAGLDRYDYAEAFAFDAPAARTPEEWSRRILLGASPSDRLTMLAVWTALTVHLSPPWTAQILGWRILHSTPDALVLGIRASIGLTARIVIIPDADGVAVADGGGVAVPHRGGAGGAFGEGAGGPLGAGTVVHAMVVRFDRALGRRVWERMAPGHRKFLRRIIGRAAR